MIARIPLKLQGPLLKAFSEYSTRPGDDHGAINALRMASAVRRIRQYDLVVDADENALYAIHNMLRAIQASGDVVGPSPEAQRLARVAGRVADRIRRAYLINVCARIDRVA